MPTRLRVGIGVVVVALMASVATARAQEAPGPDRPVPELPAAVREAQAVVLAAYPELRTAAIAWRTTTTGEGFVLTAHAAPDPFAPFPDTPPLVDTRVALDLDGRVQTLAMAGELTGRARLRTLQARAATEPAAAVVREAGGRYVPGDQVSASALASPALVRAGGSGAVADLLFSVVEEPGADALTWRVELEGATRTAPRTVLVFEPVEGRLIGLVRR